MTITGCKPEDLVNISQAAEILGVSRPTLYDLVGKGELELVRIAGWPYLVREKVEDLKRRRSGVSI